MILKTLKSFFVTLLAAVVLTSTLSFSVHKHFCGPFLKDVSIILPSHGCGMETTGMADNCAISLEKKCCNDIIEVVQGQDDLKITWHNFSLEQQQFITLFTNTYLFTITGDYREKHTFIAYSPPLVTRDIPVLHQSFLL